MKLPCSAPLLTLNSRKNLETLLPFLSEHFQDVYILDGNSTDGTLDLARKLGVRVERQFETDEPNQKISDFRAMRLRLWSLAKFDWLFILDSDEQMTPECLQIVEQVVQSEVRREAHSFCLQMQLPDLRVVEEAFFYPNRCIRLFRRSDGISLADRKLHERFVVPESVKVIEHNEAITSIWLPPRQYLGKTWRYLRIESQTKTPTSFVYLWRWVVVFNVRSLFGQTWRAVASYVRAWRYGRVALPPSYTFMLLGYRVGALLVGVYAWSRSRLKKHC